jgi:hypothetical protein
MYFFSPNYEVIDTYYEEFDTFFLANYEEFDTFHELQVAQLMEMP